MRTSVASFWTVFGKLSACADAQGVVVLDPYARAVIGRRSFGQLGPVRARLPARSLEARLACLAKGTRGQASRNLCIRDGRL